MERSGGGHERVDHRLVAGLGRAELDHSFDRGVERRRELLAVEYFSVSERRPARRSADPHSGPLAPPTVDDERLAREISSRPGGVPSPCPASALPTASKPRRMLMP